MDMKTKLGYVEQHIKSISRADDVDSVIRNRALEAIGQMIADERDAIAERLAAKADALSKAA